MAAASIFSYLALQKSISDGYHLPVDELYARLPEPLPKLIGMVLYWQKGTWKIFGIARAAVAETGEAIYGVPLCQRNIITTNKFYQFTLEHSHEVVYTWTISAVLINMFGMGLVLGYPASLLPALNLPDSDIKTDLNSSSWLGSMTGVSGVPGFLVTSVLMAIYGRKITHGLVMLPAVIGWLLIYFAKDVPTLMIGRFFCGLTATPSVSLGAIIIGEYSCPKFRGVFLYLKNASVCLGAMFLHIFSRYLHWRTIALMSVVPLLIALVINYTWYESPAWLASKHQYGKSQKAFYWLRGNSDASRKEIEEILRVQKAKMSEPKMNSNFTSEVMAFLRKFTQKDFLKPCLIVILATAVLEMSGRHIFPSYAIQIMTDITGETSHSFYYTLAIDFIITSSAVFSSFLVKILNRRTLLFSSGFAAIAVLMIFCLYLMLASKHIIPNDKPWIPISLLVLYFVLANSGCAPIPLSLVGEVFPLAHRGVGSALSGVWIAICLLAGLKSAPHLLDGIGVYGFFAVYGSIMGVCLLILYFILPETKDKTLQEIENYFNCGKYTIDEDVGDQINTKMIA